MTAEQQHKQEWINAWIEDQPYSIVNRSSYGDAILQTAAETAWAKHCEDGPADKGEAWTGGFAWNH